MFPILPRSPESLSSSLICSKNTMPKKKKKKNDLACYGYANLKFANTTYLRAPDCSYQKILRQTGNFRFHFISPEYPLR